MMVKTNVNELYSNKTFSRFLFSHVATVANLCEHKNFPFCSMNVPNRLFEWLNFGSNENIVFDIQVKKIKSFKKVCEIKD